MIISVLIWVILTLFSIFGAITFLGEPLYDLFGKNSFVNPIAIVVNFYLCNFLALILIRGSLARLNKILLYLGTGLILLITELYLGYYLIFEIFNMNDDWVIEMIFLLALFFVPFGGVLYFLKLALAQLTTHMGEFFKGIQTNTQKRFLDKASKKGVHSETIQKMRALEKQNRELKDIIKKNTK